MELNKIHNENCLTGLKSLPDNSIDCCVTSPPYYGLRDYGISEQIGLEESPEAFVEKLVQVFEEVRRVLKPKGTLWLNLGDSYNGSGGAGGDYNKGGLKEGQPKYTGRAIKGLKAKDLIGIPWMVAFALRSAGWYLRQDIIWAKPNPMPESVADRCTKSHEYIFLLSKSKQYFYDAAAIEEPCVWDTGGMTEKRVDRAEENHKAMPTVLKNGIRPKKKGPQTFGGKKARDGQESGGDPRNGHRTDENSQWGKVWDNEKPTRNKRTVWTVATKPFREAHFATFPEELIYDCIKAGCPEFICKKCGKPREAIIEKEYKVHEKWYGKKTKESKHDRWEAGNSYKEVISSKQTGLTDCGCKAGFKPGVVLDPFMGGGTTALVSRKLHRNFIGFEINPEYIKIAEKRLKDQLGMFI